jgi:hypothetical protein
MIVLAAFSRMIPHTLNFSPLGAIGLFGAAYFSKKWQAFVIPIAATWLSDLFINNVIYEASNPTFIWFYKGFYWQYGSYLLITLAAIFIFKKVDVKRILGAVTASVAIFFLISNFGCWIGNADYPQNISGLLTCYAAGLPFLKGTLSGDLFYSGVLFGIFALAQAKFPALKVSSQRAVA